MYLYKSNKSNKSNAVAVRIGLVNLELLVSSDDIIKIRDELREILDVWKHDADNEVDFAILMFALSKANKKLGNLNDACNFAQKSYEIFRRRFSEYHRYTKDAKNLLKDCPQT